MLPCELGVKHCNIAGSVESNKWPSGSQKQVASHLHFILAQCARGPTNEAPIFPKKALLAVRRLQRQLQMATRQRQTLPF